MRPLPIIAVLLGVAGLVPFVVCGLGALSPDNDVARNGILALAAYGAVILAFLGGVHWGIGLQAGDGQTVRAQRARFGLGVVPSLVGWVGLLVVFAGWPMLGLGVLVVGFVALTVVEGRGARAGMLPRGYMMLRWGLSVVVVLVLASVLMVSAFGGRLVL